MDLLALRSYVKPVDHQVLYTGIVLSLKNGVTMQVHASEERELGRG